MRKMARAAARMRVAEAELSAQASAGVTTQSVPTPPSGSDRSVPRGPLPSVEEEPPAPSAGPEGTDGELVPAQPWTDVGPAPGSAAAHPAAGSTSSLGDFTLEGDQGGP